MLIEQIIEYESRVPGPLVVHIFLKLIIFMTKQKSSKVNLRVHYLKAVNHPAISGGLQNSVYSS